MFYESLGDAEYIRRRDAKEPATPEEKLKEVRDRAKAKARGGHGWWSK